MFYIGKRRNWKLTEIIRACALRIGLKFEMGLSSRMHQKSYHRYKPNGYGSLRVSRIAADLRRQNSMVKAHLFYPSASFLFFHP